MITVEQIKAARALLSWNQQDLATSAGLSKPALANLERGTASPRLETITAIQKALEDGGVDFTDGPGVRLKGEILEVHILEGKDSIARLWNDIYETLENDEERLISGVDERKFDATMGAKFPAMMDKYIKKGIKGRILSLDGDTNFSDKSSTYRWVPENIFREVPFYVYKNKYAMLLWGPPQKVVLIENKDIAESFRKQFNAHWDSAEIPPGQ